MLSFEKFEFMKSETKEIFYDDSFRNVKEVRRLMGPMPNLDAFEEERKRVRKLAQFDYLQPCYHEPLLSVEQERFLFKKYAFLKWKVHLLIEGNYSTKNPKRYQIASNLFSEMIELRNLLTVCNLRLVVSPTKRYHIKQREELTEIGYDSVLNCVKKFDWRLGNKFSTYATWGIRNNIVRTAVNNIEYDQKHQTIDGETPKKSLVGDEDIDFEELHVNEISVVARTLFANITDSRTIEILEHRFGLNGKEQLTLKEIGIMFGVCKERIRQIEFDALNKMRQAAGVPIPKYDTVRKQKEQLQKVA